MSATTIAQTLLAVYAPGVTGNHIAPGLPNFHIVGLADKAVAESRERVRAALHASGLALPSKRITVNLAPADLPKEGKIMPFSPTV